MNLTYQYLTPGLSGHRPVMDKEIDLQGQGVGVTNWDAPYTDEKMEYYFSPSGEPLIRK